MDKSLIAAILLIPLTALGQTHTMPGSNVVPSGANITIQSGGTITADPGSTVTGFGGVGGGSPTTVNYLIGTADATLSNEIVVGTSPGGELGGTWASPTIDDGITVANWTLTTPTIAALSNLTSNGFVKTSGGVGTLSVDTTTYLSTTGDLSPLFTTAESAGNTAFTLSTAAANTVLGNASGSTAAPTFSSSPRFTAIGNLTTNGFVKTSGGVGTLSVDTATYLTSANVDDTAYAGTWDTVTTIAPSKNAVYDKINSLTATNVGLGSVTNDAQTKASVVPNTLPSSGQLLIGNAGATAYAPITMGTDATITSAGALTIANNAVTLGKMATMATDSILGRKTASTGNVEVLTALPWAFTGDVTTVADANATTIANSAVTYAKMQNVSANSRLLGSGSAGTGLPPAEITVGSGLTMTGTTLTAAGGSTTFIGLTDVPASYSGAGGKVVAVNSGATALEFVSAPAATAGGADTQVQFNDGGTVLGGDPNFVWNKTNNSLSLLGSGGSAVLVVDTPAASFLPGLRIRDSAATRYRNDIAMAGASGGMAFTSYDDTGTAYKDIIFDGNPIKLRISAVANVEVNGLGLAIRSDRNLNWSSTTDPSGTIDTALSRNTAGVVEVNNGTIGQYRDLKVDEVDAVTGYKLNGTTINLDYSNTSVTNQTPSTSDVYLVGSNIVLPAGGFKANGQYRCLFDVVKSAGTGTIVLTLRIGTLGTTGDTSRITFTFPAGTSVADTGTMEVIVNWRTVGGGTSAVVSGLCRAQKNNITAAGLWNTTSAALTIVGTVSGGFDSSAATTIGMSFNGGTAFAGTITTVQSNLFQK